MFQKRLPAKKSKRQIVSKTSKPPKNSSAKLALLTLIFIAALILFGKGFQLISSITKPLDRASQGRIYSWDGNSSLTLAVKTRSIHVLSFDPTEKEVTILKIPDETYIELPKGLGFWPASSIYPLGEAENPPVGPALLKQSLSKLLGLPVEGFLIFPETEQSFEKIVESLKKNPLTILGYLKKINSDLTPIELLRLNIALSQIRADKFINLDLAQTDITKSKLLPDSTRVLGIDNIKLDLFIREKMSDLQMVQEDTSIAIFNATSHPGLAQQLMRFITNMGGSVIFAGNTENYLDKTVVISDNKSYTARKLTSLFAPWCLGKLCSINDLKVSSSRAEINIVLGEDYFKLHQQK